MFDRYAAAPFLRFFELDIRERSFKVRAETNTEACLGGISGYVRYHLAHEALHENLSAGRILK